MTRRSATILLTEDNPDDVELTLRAFAKSGVASQIVVARTQRLPVVALTSSTEDSDLVASYHLGANSYAREPVDFARFLEAARQLGLYWLVLDEPSPDHGGER